MKGDPQEVNRVLGVSKEQDFVIVSSSASLPLNDVGPKIKSFFKRTLAGFAPVQRKNPGSAPAKLGPIALCARLEDS